jgi:NACalpha-BTF3-like transcription factor
VPARKGEPTMTKLIPIGVVLAMPISPTFAAEQYRIVQQSISSCTIVNEKPKSDIEMIDNKAYASRAEAERAMKAMKGCTPE